MAVKLPWWRRLFGASPPPAAPAVRPALTPPAPAPAPAVWPAGLLRRPLIGRRGAVAAYEWRFAGRERPSPALLAQALAAAAQAGRPGLLQAPRALVLRPATLTSLAAARGPSAVTLCLDTLPAGPETALLREAGCRIGAPAQRPVREPVLDMVVAHPSGAGLDTLLRAAEHWRETQPRTQLVALGLADAGEAEQLLAGGFDLAGGDLSARGGSAPTRPLGTAAHRICALLGQLALDADTAPLAEMVRGDVALGYRLLRYANSPVIGLSRPVETVEQAIAVLGRRELERWLQVMLIGTAQARPAQKALEEHALVRARLLERLAERRGDPEPGTAFTLGLLSMMGQLLQAPLDQVLEPLRLRADLADALLSRRGPYAAQLALVDAIDAPDESLAWAAAAALGQADILTEEAEAAWQWVSGLLSSG